MNDLVAQIHEELERKNAVLLAHNYQRPEVQDAADITGDSLELSIKASHTDARMIIFCGVHFMAESAAILSPDKQVVLPRFEAGCPMADMIDGPSLVAWKKDHPDAAVVTYVNSSAEVKALSDICCTSANAVTVVRSLSQKKIIFTPDKNLASWVARHVPEKEIIPWNGYCPTHQKLTPDEVLLAKRRYPNALVMVHPECRPEVVDLADAVKSTSGMLTFTSQSDAVEFLVGTEIGLLHPLSKLNPEKKFYPIKETMVCPNMKLTTLPDILSALKNPGRSTVRVPDDIRQKAKAALDRMLEIPKD